jgi:hypothetical protein
VSGGGGLYTIFGSVKTEISPSAHPQSKNLLSFERRIDKTGFCGEIEKVLSKFKNGISLK